MTASEAPAMVGNRSDGPVISTYAVGDFGKQRSGSSSAAHNHLPRSLLGTVGTASAVAIVAVGGTLALLSTERSNRGETAEVERLDRGVPSSRVVLTYADDSGEAATPAAAAQTPVVNPGLPASGTSEPPSIQPFLGVVTRQPGTEQVAAGTRANPSPEDRRNMAGPSASAPVLLADLSCGHACLAMPEGDGYIETIAPAPIAETPERIGIDAPVDGAAAPRSELIVDSVVGELATSGARPDVIALGEVDRQGDNIARSDPSVATSDDRESLIASSANALGSDDHAPAREGDNQSPVSARLATVQGRVATPLATEESPSLVRQDIERHIRSLSERHEEPPSVAQEASLAKETTAAREVESFLSNVYERSATFSASGTELGTSTVLIREDQLVAVKLGELISLFEDQLGRSLFVWLSSSDAASKYVTPASLAAAGIETTFDPQTRQIVLSVDTE